ncbi:MAG TPA: DUF6659 family protein [Nitrososphaeraceae archaeon]
MPFLGSFEQLCDNIFELSSNIRFVGIINGMGDLVAGGMREGVRSMEDRENSSKLYLEFLLRSEMRKDQDAEFGKTVYSFSEREKIKFAVFPLLRYHLLMVSLEKRESNHDGIIEKILNLTSKYGTNANHT